jgi:hypothetical protein
VNFYDVINPSNYLSHTSVPVDSNIWYSQSGLCSGADNMLNTAVLWIEPNVGVSNQAAVKPTVKIYPNPSDGIFSIVVSTPVSETMNIRVCNVLGATIKTTSANLTAGEQAVKMDLSDMHLPVGNYFLLLQSNSLGSLVKKMTIIN